MVACRRNVDELGELEWVMGGMGWGWNGAGADFFGLWFFGGSFWWGFVFFFCILLVLGLFVEVIVVYCGIV